MDTLYAAYEYWNVLKVKKSVKSACFDAKGAVSNPKRSNTERLSVILAVNGYLF